jgi:hypothetical protein
MFERDWGNHAALWRSGVGVADAPVFQYASTQPFVDQVQQHIVTHPTSKKLSQVTVIQIVERQHFLIPISTTGQQTAWNGWRSPIRRSRCTDGGFAWSRFREVRRKWLTSSCGVKTELV